MARWGTKNMHFKLKSLVSALASSRNGHSTTPQRRLNALNNLPILQHKEPVQLSPITSGSVCHIQAGLIRGTDRPVVSDDVRDVVVCVCEVTPKAILMPWPPGPRLVNLTETAAVLAPERARAGRRASVYPPRTPSPTSRERTCSAH